MAKEAKRAARAEKPLFGFGRKKASSEDGGDEFALDPSLKGGQSGDPSAAASLDGSKFGEMGLGQEGRGEAEQSAGQRTVEDIFAQAPGQSRSAHEDVPSPMPAPEPDAPEIIIDEDIKIIPAKSRARSAPSPVTPAASPAGMQPTRATPTPSMASFDFSTPEGRAKAKKALEEAEAQAAAEAIREEEAAKVAAAEKSSGTLIRRKAKAEPAPQPPAPRGTEIRPVGASPEPIEPLQAGARRSSPSTETQDAVAQSFAALRSAVDGREQTPVEPLASSNPESVLASIEPLVPGNGGAEPDDVLILDNPVTNAPPAAAPISKAAGGPAQGHDAPAGLGFSENWVGLWVAEDGQAIFIEDDDDGWHAVTVLQDPTTKCFSGPDYPEIQTFRMPAIYAQEEIGDFEGERFSVITVPGLPEEHRSPVMFLYFLTSIPASQGGGNRFATPDDATNRVFLVADFELGSVNPWSDEDDIEWIDPSVNFYKAPGKLDAYMARRMSNEDPLN